MITGDFADAGYCVMRLSILEVKLVEYELSD
jgi:hypothetical protein